MAEDHTKVIRERSDNGRLMKAGLAWRERRWALAYTGAALITFGLLGWLLAWGLSNIRGGGPTAASIAMFSSLLLLFGYLFVWPWSRRLRSLIFHADGTMEMPQGLPDYPLRRAIGGHHNSLISIEQRKSPDQTFKVIGISTGGDTVKMARELSESEALKVAVQLTRALNDLRQDLASGADFVAPALPLRSGAFRPGLVVN